MSDNRLTTDPQIHALRRVLSGMRPTGKLHLGNYMGALHNWVRLQDERAEDPGAGAHGGSMVEAHPGQGESAGDRAEHALGRHKYECYFFIADYHALTTDYADPGLIAQNTLDVALDWLAAGLDPDRSTLFVQSHVPQHAELHLILSMMTPLGWLERVPTYKEQQENLTGKDLSTYGFLGYPLLQSADILLYQAHLVPVGQDQVAHVELTREIARRFNQIARSTELADLAEDASERGSAPPPTRHAEILPEPQVLLTPSPRLPGTDGRKMSKSYGNTILMTDPEPVIRQKLKPMVTDPARIRRSDPGDPDKCPVGDLHKVFSSPETLASVYQGCRSAGIGCIECKTWAADSIVAALAPIQERRRAYEADGGLVRDILHDGAARARARAAQTMREVKTAMHLMPDRPDRGAQPENMAQPVQRVSG